jgi:G protein-coupled receptor Mth (Methuselah protein)
MKNLFEKALFIFAFGLCLMNISSENCSLTNQCSNLALTNRNPNDFTNCFCDQCELYSDCCADKHVTNISKSSLIFECNIRMNQERNNSTNLSVRIYSVSKCGKEFKINEIRRKCENNFIQEAEIIDILPLYSKQTGLFYKNIYCAICTIEDIQLEQMEVLRAVSGSDRNESDLDKQTFLNEILLQLKENQVKDVKYEAPSHVKNLPYCETTIEECPLGTNDSELEEFCRNHTSFRYVDLGSMTEPKIYKNEYCAKCNLEQEELLCNRPFVSPLMRSVPKHLVSLKLLFDLRNLKDEISISLKIMFKDQTYESIANLSAISLTQIDFFSLSNQTRLNKNITMLKEFCMKYESKSGDELRSERVKAYITVVGQTISIVCLLFLLLMYFSNKVLRNLPGKILICLSISLLFSQFFFLLSSYLTEPQVRIIEHTNCINMFLTRQSLLKSISQSSDCYTLGLLTHYFNLTFFSWTLIMAYDLYKMFTMLSNKCERSTSDNDDLKMFVRFSLFSWGCPFVIVLLLVTSQFLFSFKMAYAYGSCFISNQLDKLMYFIGPVLVIIVFNTYFLSQSIGSIKNVDYLKKKYLNNGDSTKSSSATKSLVIEPNNQQNDASQSRSFVSKMKKFKVNFKERDKVDSNDKKRLILFVKLFILTGMSWIFGLVASFTDFSLVWYIFVSLNSFQGLFIFFSFAFNPHTKRQLRTSRLYRTVTSSLRKKDSFSHTNSSYSDLQSKSVISSKKCTS